MDRDHYDIIIAGGGASGLSLAYHLMLSPLRKLRMLIIDKDDDDQLNRNWGYWADEPTPFDSVLHHSWNRLDFASPSYQQRFNMGSYQYRLMHGRDFYRYALEQLVACPNVTFLKTVIRKTDSGVDTTRLVTDEGEFTANWVFDSIIRFSELKNGLSGSHLIRIQKDSARIVASLVKNGHPFAVPRDGAFFRLCDRLLLDVMQHHGDEISAIFTEMFKRNPIDRVLRFLDERSNALDNLLLIASLPPRRFIQAFMKLVPKRS